MPAPFTLDGVSYDVFVPAGGLTRSFQVLDGENAGRLLDGSMERDIIGTYYNYEVQIRTERASLSEYDQLYEVLSAPQAFHTLTFPYGQSTLTFRAYVTTGKDTLQRISQGRNYWTGLSVQFVAQKPQRT